MWMETANVRDQYSFLLISVLNCHLRYWAAVPLLTLAISLLECCTRSVLEWPIWSEKTPRGIKKQQWKFWRWIEKKPKVGLGVEKEGENYDNINKNRENSSARRA